MDTRKKITPSAACRKGGIHVWVNAVRNAARVAKCHEAIPVYTGPCVHIVKTEDSAETSAESAAAETPAAPTRAMQEKLADILYQWTDEDDWSDTFGMIDPYAEDLGSLMFSAVITK